MKNMWKFAAYSEVTAEQAEQSAVGQLLKRVQNGESIPLEDFEPEFSELYHHNSYVSGIVRHMGWIFDFTPYFKKYLVKDVGYTHWHEQCAPSVQFIYGLSIDPNSIERVVELPEEDACA